MQSAFQASAEVAAPWGESTHGPSADIHALLNSLPPTARYARLTQSHDRSTAQQWDIALPDTADTVAL